MVLQLGEDAEQVGWDERAEVGANSDSVLSLDDVLDAQSVALPQSDEKVNGLELVCQRLLRRLVCSQDTQWHQRQDLLDREHFDTLLEDV